MIHAQIVAHFVRYHIHRLKVIAFIDGATVLRVAHAGDPSQTNHTVLFGVHVIEVQTR